MKYFFPSQTHKLEHYRSRSAFESASYYNAGVIGVWWTSTDYNTNYAWHRIMGADYEYVGNSPDTKKATGNSIRCVKD